MQKMTACIPQWFGGIDPAPHVYEVYAENSRAKEAFQRFKEDGSAHLKLLYCIDMLNEGIHVGDISGVILCRPTVSPIVYKQQVGRALSAMKTGTPLIFDLVNNVEHLYSVSAVRREMEALVTYYCNEGRGGEIVRQGFELFDEVRECRELFEKLEEALTASWDRMFAEASAYHAAHGDLNIPKRYRTESGLALGNWIQTQRRVRSGSCFGTLTQERVEKLDAIGMVWQSPQETSWENGYAHAKAYRDAHGDLDVPVRYVCPDGFRLGSWLCNRRTEHANVRKRSGLTAEQTERLNALGMIWNRVDYGFERGCCAAAKYAAEYGHLRVPASYADGSGFKLGRWLANIRLKRQQLTQEQQQRLNSLGMCWEDAHQERWEASFALAARYREQHGDLNIPAKYEAAGVLLGRWLRRQQEAYAAGRLSQEKARRLIALGMPEAPKPGWERMFLQAKEYHDAHGDLRVPSASADARLAALYAWLKAQRKAYGEGRLSQAQAAALEALGMAWEPPGRAAWKRRFQQLAECYDPRSGKPVSREKVLCAWFRRQRQRAATGGLEPWQQALWDTLPPAAGKGERRFA